MRYMAVGAVLACLIASRCGGQELSIQKLEAAVVVDLIESTGSPQKGEAVVYEKVIKADEDKSLVRLTATVQGKWTAAGGPIQVASKEIQFTAVEGAANWVGSGMGEGVVSTSAKPSVFLMPPMGNAAAREAQQVYTWYVAVPKGAKGVGLKVGKAEAKADLAAEPVKVDPAEWMEFRTVTAKWVDAPAGAPAGDGKWVMVNLEIVPKKANSIRQGFPEMFSFYTSGLNVRVGEKVCGVEGYLVNSAFMKPTAYSVSTTAPGGKWLAIKLTALFRAPQSSPSVDVLWLGRMAAQVKAGN